MIVAKKSEQSSWKKMRLIKMTAAKKSEQNSVRLKIAPYKNDCGQKNRSKTVEKMGPFISGQKKINRTV